MANTEIISSLKQKSEQYRSEGLALIAKADVLDVAISVLQDSTSTVAGIPHLEEIPKNDAPILKGLGITQKVIAIIKHVGHFMPRQDIEVLAERYGSKFNGVIASTISSDRKKPDCELELTVYGGNKVWGLKSWVVDGKIIDGREPK